MIGARMPIHPTSMTKYVMATASINGALTMIVLNIIKLKNDMMSTLT